MPGVRADGVQRLVSVLQELEEGGEADDSVCCEAAFSGGECFFLVVFGVEDLMMWGLAYGDECYSTIGSR